MVAGDWQPHVPAATVGRPHFHGAVVGCPTWSAPCWMLVTDPRRPHRTGRLRQDDGRPLWDEVDERPFAWLRIDHLDDDPAHLLLHIAMAVAGVHPLDRDVLRYLRGPGRSPLIDLVPALGP